jgi:hypothetical protein
MSYLQKKNENGDSFLDAIIISLVYLTTNFYCACHCFDNSDDNNNNYIIWNVKSFQ